MLVVGILEIVLPPARKSIGRQSALMNERRGICGL